MPGKYDDFDLNAAARGQATSAIAGVDDISPQNAATGLSGAGPMGVQPVVAARTPDLAKAAITNSNQTQAIAGSNTTRDFVSTADPAHVAAVKNNLPDMAATAHKTDAWGNYMQAGDKWWDPLLRAATGPLNAAANSLDSSMNAFHAASKNKDWEGQATALGQVLMTTLLAGITTARGPQLLNRVAQPVQISPDMAKQYPRYASEFGGEVGKTSMTLAQSLFPSPEAQQALTFGMGTPTEAPILYKDGDPTWADARKAEDDKRQQEMVGTHPDFLMDNLAKMAGSMVDPATLTLMAATGGMGEAAVSKLGWKPVAEGAELGLNNIARTVTAGLIENSPFVAAQAGVAKLGGEQYGPEDAVRDLFTGAVMHTAMHFGGEALFGKSHNVEIGDAPPPGVNPIVDTLRKTYAETDAQSIAKLQEAVAENPVTTASPSTMKAFLDHGNPDRTVEVDPEKLLELQEEHDVLPQYTEQAHQAAADGDFVKVPLSDYLMETAGKPFADDLNNATNFRDGGVSVNDAAEAPKAEPAPPPPLPKPELPEGEAPLGPEEEARLKTVATAYAAKAEEMMRPWAISTLIHDPKTLGMTKPQFEAYAKGIEEAITATREKAMAQAVKQVIKERKPEFRDAVKRHTARIKAEIENMQAVKAMRQVTQKGWKLNKDLTEYSWPEPSSRLPSTAMHSRGAKPDDIADFLRDAGVADYGSGGELVSGLADLQSSVDASEQGSLTKFIDWQAKGTAPAAARTELGYDLSPEHVQETAARLVPQDKIKKFLTAETQAILHQMAPGQKVSTHEISMRSGVRFSEETVKDVKDLKAIARYEKLSNRAGVKAELALQKGDLVKAFYWKQIQLARRQDFANALKFQGEYKASMTTFQRYAGLRKLEGMDQEHMDLIHAVLSEHGFQVPRGNLTRTYKQFVDDNYRNMVPVVPFRAIAGVHPDNLTVGEFGILEARIQNLIKMGKEAHLVTVAGRQMELDHVAAEVEKVAAGLKQRPYDSTPGGGKGVKDLVDRVDAYNYKPEVMIDTLDAKNPNGWLNRVLMRPSRGAGGKAVSGLASHIDEITKLLDKMPNSLRDWMNTRVASGHGLMDPRRPNVEQNLYGSHLIGIALNAANERGRWHLGKGGNGYSDVAIDKAIERLSPEAKEFVDKIHSIMGDVQDKIIEGEHAITGVAPEQVEGKYFPLRRDEFLSSSLKGALKTDERELGAHWMAESATSRGHTLQGRNNAYPVDLDWQSTLRIYLPSQAKRLAYADFLGSANRFLDHPTIQRVIEDVHGPYAMREFKNWLARQVGFYPQDPRAVAMLNAGARELRLRTYGTVTGLKLTIGLEHATSLPQTMAVAGKAFPFRAYANAIGRGIFHFLGNPNATAEFIRQNSPYMNARHDAATQAFADSLRDAYAGKGIFVKIPVLGKVDKDLRVFSNNFFNMINHSTVASPTWMQAYNDATAGKAIFMGNKLTEKMSHEDAVAFADKIVGKSHGSGMELDMGSAQSGGSNEALKLLNMFNAFRGNLGSLVREGTYHMVNDQELAQKVKGLEMVLIAAFGVPAMGKLVTDQGPSNWEDPQEVALWAAETMFEGLSHVQWGGPIVEKVGESYLAKKPLDWDVSPGFGELKIVSQGLADVIDAARRGILHDKKAKGYGHQQIRDVVNMLGFLADGLPLDQPGETMQAIWDEAHKRVPRPIHGLIYGQPHEQPKKPLRIAG